MLCTKACNMLVENYTEIFKKLLKNFILDVTYLDSIYYLKADHVVLKELFLFLKLHTLCQFSVLYDLSLVVNPYSEIHKNKFTIYYYLTSLKFNCKMIVGSQIHNETTILDSLFLVYKSCIWLEREVWDMFGVFFKGNPDLRRILTDYGFRHNPLLKEFPLKGYYELKYCDSSSILQYVKVNDQQQIKIFDFKNPWKFFYN